MVFVMFSFKIIRYKRNYENRRLKRALESNNVCQQLEICVKKLHISFVPEYIIRHQIQKIIFNLQKKFSFLCFLINHLFSNELASTSNLSFEKYFIYYINRP